MVLKKKTIDDPNAVTAHVKRVANNANKTGLYSNRNSKFIVYFKKIEGASNIDFQLIGKDKKNQCDFSITRSICILFD